MSLRPSVTKFALTQRGVATAAKPHRKEDAQPHRGSPWPR